MISESHAKSGQVIGFTLLGLFCKLGYKMVLDNLSITKILLLKLLSQTKVIVNPKQRSNIKKGASKV